VWVGVGLEGIRGFRCRGRPYLFESLLQPRLGFSLLLRRLSRHVGCRRELGVRVQQRLCLAALSGGSSGRLGSGRFLAWLSRLRACCLSWVQPAFPLGVAILREDQRKAASESGVPGSWWEAGRSKTIGKARHMPAWRGGPVSRVGLGSPESPLPKVRHVRCRDGIGQALICMQAKLFVNA